MSQPKKSLRLQMLSLPMIATVKQMMSHSKQTLHHQIFIQTKTVICQKMIPQTTIAIRHQMMSQR